MIDRQQLTRDLAGVINRHSLENESNTPDFIIAEYLVRCLDNFAITSTRREKWYGKSLGISSTEIGVE